MADDRMNDSMPSDESQGSPFGPLQAVARRWPFLLAGAVLGIAFGIVYNVVSTKFYQSSAQLLVLEKRAGVTSITESRYNVVADYVSTQLTIIKSERIRRAAAVELRKLKTRMPLPEDDNVLAGMFMGVTASRETSAATGQGNNILNLAFRGVDPNDTKVFLSALITAYRKELENVYDAQTQDRIDTLKKSIAGAEVEKTNAASLSLAKERELRKITTEVLSSIQARISAYKADYSKLKLDEVRIVKELELIKATGQDRRRRLETVIKITGTKGPGNETGGPEQNLRILEAQRKAKLEKLGKDHPEIKELDAQILYYKEEEARLNPSGGAIDELGGLELRLQYQL
ncbi:MAG: Wzz/FepE/Etk N-terminal domain-containing protein, partial [Fimbriiglobus sp.]